MKHLIIIFSISVFASGLFAQKGIGFIHPANWEEILAKAETENKPIFMDAFTTWCGPCKKMSREVFPDKAVSDFYNKNFINVKIDMEKGIGIALAEKYNVAAYPTLLFIDKEGVILHRHAGFQKTEEFIALGQRALSPSKNLAAMETRFKQGERTSDFLADYLKLRYHAADDSHTAIAEAYLNTQKDWRTDENLTLIYTMINTTESPMYDYLTEQRSSFDKKFGASSVDKRIKSLIYNTVKKSDDPKKTLKKVDDWYVKAFPKAGKKLAGEFIMNYYRQNNDARQFAKTARRFIKQFPDLSADERNDIIWSFFDVVTNKRHLKKALKWSKNAVNEKNTYANNDVLAAIYFKLGKKEEAINAAKTAINIAQKSGEDYSLTEELLEEMMQK